MKIKILFPLRISLISTFLLIVSGCAGIEEDPTADWDAEQLYYAAKKQMDEGFYDQSLNLYRKLDLRYPYGSYAEQAKIDVAYVYWKQDDTISALTACDRYLREHPDSENSAYILYLKALINFNDDMGLLAVVFPKDLTERDPASAKAAFDILRELVTRFPNSRYAEDARLRMSYLVGALAEHEVSVAEYYYRRGAYVAAINRAQGVMKDYPKTRGTQKALEVLSASYEKMGLLELQEGVETLIEINFSGERVGLTRPAEDPWWNFLSNNEESQEQNSTVETDDEPSWWKFWVDDGAPPNPD